MTIAKPKYRRPLNSEQLAVLTWLYIARFSTSKHIARYLHKPNPKGIQNKLQILEERGYIGKHYDKTYKLAGRAAEYFLTPKGARQLPADSVNEWAIKSLYKNKTVSPDFIAHCLNVADTILTLQALYGDKLGIFSKSHMAACDYFPSWTPDLFLSLKAGSNRRRYFLDVLDDTKLFFVAVRKVRNYINYAADGDWPHDEAGDLPTVLVICKDEPTQKKLGKQIRYALDDTEDIAFATATQEQLGAATATSKLWCKITEDGELTHISL